MRSTFSHRYLCIGHAWLLTAFAFAPLAARADTVASLLGNFTVNQYCGLKLAADGVDVRYAVVFGELPALRELHIADANGDGVTTQAERDAYVQRLAPTIADGLKLAIDGSSVPLRAIHWTSSLPSEQGGFSLRLDVEFSGALPHGAGGSPHMLTFSNQNYAGQIGWNEITAQAARSVAVFDTNAFSTSLTSALTAAVQTLPASGPLAERTIHLSFLTGAAPPGAKPLGARPGLVPLGPERQERSTGDGANRWLQRHTRDLVGLISAPHVAPHVALLALLIALLLGAVHALSPGHGKTIVGAYLIGSRGTPRHALFLGVTVTITHTLGVFALGFATLAASRFIVPERLFPVLSLASGLLVLGMGIFLLAQRSRATRGFNQATRSSEERASHAHEHRRPKHDHDPGTHSHVHHTHPHRIRDDHEHAHEHEEHAHTHRYHSHKHDPADRAHRGDHDAATSFTHSHGGSVHSHLPPAALAGTVSWRGLLALGISGGLVPCPSAMVLLLAAVALNKTAYGLLLVIAFSVGLATTLTLVGLAFLYARNRFRRPASSARWARLLPVASAAAITIVGAVLSIGAVQSLFIVR